MRLGLGGTLFTLASASLVGIAACSLGTTEPFVPCSRFTPLAIGDSIKDSLTTSSCRALDRTYENFYRFQLAAQTNLRVTLSSPADTAYLHVTDSSGVLIVNSVYSTPAGTTATLKMILKAGTYYLGVNSWHSTPSGAFRVSTAVDNSAVAGCEVTWLTYGVTTAQNITSGDCTAGPGGSKYYYHLYRMVILRVELAFTEHATGFVPQTVLVSSTGGTLGASSLDSTGTNARVKFTPTTEDLLILWVGSQDSLQVGAYSLTIQ